jgi:hypothetical protein
MLLEDDKLMDWEEDVDWEQEGLFDADTPAVTDPHMDLNSWDGIHQNRCTNNTWTSDTDAEVDMSEKGQWLSLRQKLVTHSANPEAKSTMKWNTLPKGRMKH